MGEQTNPWRLLHPQDILSRHRGRERARRYVLSRPTTLLSPGQLLSVKPRLFPKKYGGSLRPAFAPARPVSLTVKLAFAFILSSRFPSGISQPLHARVTFQQATAPVKLPTRHCPIRRFQTKLVRFIIFKERCFIVGRQRRPPSYAKQLKTNPQYQAAVKLHGVFLSCSN